ncbi:hypothetical protein V8G54_023226 [Vigna mungo]|uniref:Uncharacterized protein n=1 Tax=Vigna mungo TaxID=3915 RepID=A0AAQ3N4E0_VIGMU
MTEMRQPFVRASLNPAGEEERKKAHSKSATNKRQKIDIDDGLDGVLEEQEVEIKALEEELAVRVCFSLFCELVNHYWLNNSPLTAGVFFSVLLMHDSWNTCSWMTSILNKQIGHNEVY